MHIILIILLVLSGLVWGIVNLQREIRRRQWAKQNINPLFSIESPRELMATLAFALLKCGGDLTTDQKNALLESYEKNLEYSSKDAVEMYSYASYLISTDPNYNDKIGNIAATALGNFSNNQKTSALSLLQDLVTEPTEAQSRFIEDAKSTFALGESQS